MPKTNCAIDGESWNKRHIDHMTLTVKSKGRQNGGGACVATVEVNFFSAAFRVSFASMIWFK